MRWLPLLWLAACADVGFNPAVDAAAAVDAAPAPDGAIAPPTPDAAPPAPDAAPPALPDIAFDHYHSQAEIAAYLRAVAAARPDVTTFEVLGTSGEGREIAALTINSTGRADAPVVLLNGTHHGDEKPATETPLGVVDHLLRHGDDPDVAAVLGRYAIVAMPLLNPDGHARNTRENAGGDDINRDYSHPGRSEADSFHTPEARVMKALQDRVRFHGALAYHTGIEEVIWPWAYQAGATANAAVFSQLARADAEAMGFDRYLQSYEDYPTDGEYIDYAYSAHQTMALTVELSDALTPPASELAPIVTRGVRGTMAYLKALSDHDRGLRAPVVVTSFGTHGGAPVVGGEKRE